METRKDIQFKTQPLMLAAWQGPGNAGILAVDYLRIKLETKPLATIDMSSVLEPRGITVQDGMVGAPHLPKNSFFYREDPDILIFESEEQIMGKEGIFMIEAMLEIAKHYKVQRILTVDALHQRPGNNQPYSLYCASNDNDLLQTLVRFGISPLKEGEIAGPSGMLPGIAKARGIEAACLLAPIPHFASNLPYPKASLEIVKAIETMVGVSLDLTDLKKSVKMVEDLLHMPGDKEPEKLLPDNHVPAPKADTGEKIEDHVLARIEELFKEVEQDKSKAGKLKEELDRWNLFEKYEKRFLDMFK